MHVDIANKLAEIAALCEVYDVAKLEIFGSAARADDFDRRLSDVDFLVEFHQPGSLGALEEFFGFRDSLSKLLGRPVDLIEAKAIRNPFFLSAVNSARQMVYAA